MTSRPLQQDLAFVSFMAAPASVHDKARRRRPISPTALSQRTSSALPAIPRGPHQRGESPLEQSRGGTADRQRRAEEILQAADEAEKRPKQQSPVETGDDREHSGAGEAADEAVGAATGGSALADPWQVTWGRAAAPRAATMAVRTSSASAAERRSLKPLLPLPPPCADRQELRMALARARRPALLIPQREPPPGGDTRPRASSAGSAGGRVALDHAREAAHAAAQVSIAVGGGWLGTSPRREHAGLVTAQSSSLFDGDPPVRSTAKICFDLHALKSWINSTCLSIHYFTR